MKMWNTKKLRKKAGAIILTATVATSLLSPFSVLAEDKTQESQAIVQEDGNTTNPVVAGTEEDVVEEKKEEKKTAESEEGKRSYDTTKPVIEKVTFEQNGKTLKPGDTVKVVIEAYDTDSGIDRIDATIRLRGEWATEHADMNVVHKEGTNEYEITYRIAEDALYVEGEIYWLRVVDKAGNSEEVDVSKNFSFEIEPAEKKTYVISDLEFAGQGQTYSLGDYVELSYALKDYILSEPLERMEVLFEGPEGFVFGQDAYYNSETGKYSFSNYVQEYMPEGKWELKSISSQQSGETIYHDISGLGSVWFNVEKSDDGNEEGGEDGGEEDADEEGPMITSIELSNNGEFVKPGDKITITVKAEDNVGLDKTNSYMSATFNAVADDIDYPQEDVSLVYDEEKDAFVGTFHITEDTYPCEWYLYYVSIYDMEGNFVENSHEMIGELGYPYYVKVQNGGTFVEPTTDLYVNFKAVDKNGKWTYFPGETYEVPWRESVTLKEAGIELPTPTETFGGLNFECWVDEEGNVIDENTKVSGIHQYELECYAKYDKTPVTIFYDYMDKDGDHHDSAYQHDYKLHIFPEDITYKELRELTKELPHPQETYEGFNFQGWDILTDEEDNKVVTGDARISLKAVYDKCVGYVTYAYMDKNSIWKTAKKIIPIDKEDDPDEVMENLKAYRVTDGTDKATFKRWETDFSEELQDYADIKFEAVYEDGKIAIVRKSYYDETGKSVGVEEASIIEEGTTYAEVLNKALEEPLPKMLEGAKFDKWSFGENDMREEPIEEDRYTFYLDAQYKNFRVSYRVLESEEDMEKLHDNPLAFKLIKAQYYEAADMDDEVTLPNEIEDYTIQKYYTVKANASTGGLDFEEVSTKTYKVEENVNFIVIGTLKEDPDKPVDPEDPDKPTDPEEPQKPSTELPQDVVDKEVDKINKGEDVQIQMGEATVVPKEILEAAKGKDVEIKLDMGDYTWTINGKDIQANSLKDINLEVEVDSNAIPDKIVSELAGDNPTCQLSLTHNGPFGFKAELTVNVGAENSGKFGNLYYYDSDGKMIYKNAGKVDADGNVTLTFDHASDYVIVLSEKQMSQDDVPPTSEPTNPNEGNNENGNQNGNTNNNNNTNTNGNADTNANENVNENTNETVKTGDTAPIFVFAALAIVSACAVAFVLKRRMTR